MSHFIVLEGGEGAGKSTQIVRLAEYLREQGKDVVVTREPGGTPEAEKLRHLFAVDKDCDWSSIELLLIVNAARAHHVRNIIKPALDAGSTVLCDRYVGSTLAYQGYAGGIDEKIILDMHKVATNDLWPDITLVLDIDPEIGLQRGMERGHGSDQRFESKKISFHNKLRDFYQLKCKESSGQYKFIDASKDQDQVFQALKGAVKAVTNV